MQTSARYQAILELLDEVFQDKTPADVILNRYLRARKYIGSKDRRFITDTLWDIIRHRMRLTFDAQSTKPRDILLTYLKNEDFDIITGGPHGLEPLTDAEKHRITHIREDVYPFNVELECPDWLFQKINNPALISSLNQQATIDIRANFISRDELKNRLQKDGLFFSKTPYSPFGLRSSDRLNLNNCICYHEGLFDLQDEACQVAACLCNIHPSAKIIDYCAGAGGKSLALGALLQNEGLIYCHDIDFHRMDVIKERAERLGIKNLRLINRLQDTDFDCFIIDSPCSGSGTWRRAPDAKFRLTPERLEELTKIQFDILQTAYQHTKSGGRIIYMTCSVLNDENENIVQKFASLHPDIRFADHRQLWQDKIGTLYPFHTSEYLNFSPLLTSTDGFFFCMLHKH